MNIRGNIWIKGLSFLLASLAGVWTLACLAVTLLMSFEPEMQGGREDYENFFYERALKVYGADFFSHNLWDETIRQEEIMEACEGFDGGNVKFTLIRENTDQTVSTLYSNDRTVGAEDYQAKGSTTVHGGTTITCPLPWGCSGGTTDITFIMISSRRHPLTCCILRWWMSLRRI